MTSTRKTLLPNPVYTSILCLLIFFIHIHVHGQSSHTPPPLKLNEQKSEKGSSVHVDYEKAYLNYQDPHGIKVDKRLFYYVSVEHIKEMDKISKLQQNFFIQHSYLLHSSCPNINAETFDIFQYRYLRAQDKRVSITLPNGCGYVELMSQNELDLIFEQIALGHR